MIPGKAYPERYAAELDEKTRYIKTYFQEFSIPEIDIFPSPTRHFRMRAEFKIWHEAGKAYYAMFEPGKYKKAIKIDDFSIGSELICKRMPVLLEIINESETLKNKLFQIEFLSSLKGEVLITLIYHKPLGAEWEALAQEIEARLDCYIIGRSRKQKILLSRDYISEVFTVNGRAYLYQQVETGFTQPNASVCQAMLEWAANTSQHLGGDLLELYCGNGNFTLPLSQNFEKVLATEVSKTSVKSALYNIAENGIENIELVRLSSEEFTQAINKERPFRRLQHLNLDDYNFSTIFVDPPRAGLDAGTLELAARFENIMYVSCNPETLKENLEILHTTHTILHFALFDQFPYTDHIECGVVLKKR